MTPHAALGSTKNTLHEELQIATTAGASNKLVEAEVF
jgi:hypothetical protein